MPEEVKEEVLEEEHPEEEKKKGFFGKVKSAIIPDAEAYFDAYSVVQEFEEWLEPDSSEPHEIFSLAYIGDESEYQ